MAFPLQINLRVCRAIIFTVQWEFIKITRCAQHQRKHLHAFADKTLIEINISAKCGSALNPVYNYSRHQRPRVNKQSNYQSARAAPFAM